MLRNAHAGSGLMIAALLVTSTSRGQPAPAAWAAQTPPAAPSAAGPQPSLAQPVAAGPTAVSVRPVAQAIVVEPGATCLDPAKLAGRVARWLQRDLIDARIRIRVQGDTSRENRVSFVIERGGGDRAERSIPDAPEDCDQLHSALALSIALAIDASIGGGSLPPSELPSDEQLLAKPEKPQPPYFRFAFAMLGHGTAGLLTDTSFAGSGRLELGFFPWLDLRLGALVTRIDSQPLRPAGVDGNFYVNLTAVRVDACAAQTVGGGVRILACTGGIAGALRTRGRNFSADQEESRLWSAAVAGVEAQALLLSWLAISGSVDMAVPLAKHRIQAVDPQGRVIGERQLTPIAVLVGGGLVFRVF